MREPGRGDAGAGAGAGAGRGRAPVRGRHPVARRRTPRRPASGGWGEGGSARSRRNVGRRETRGPSLRASSARGRRTATSSPPKAWSLCSAPFLRRSRSRRSLRSARRDADREEEEALPPSMVEWEASQRRRALLTGAVRLVLAVVRFRLSWARQDRLRRMASSQKDGSANSNARATDLKCRRLCRTPREHSTRACGTTAHDPSSVPERPRTSMSAKKPTPVKAANIASFFPPSTSPPAPRTPPRWPRRTSRTTRGCPSSPAASWTSRRSIPLPRPRARVGGA